MTIGKIVDGMDHIDPGYQRIPIIKLWTLLLVPLQGELTDNLASQLTSEVLTRIHDEGCSGLVIDITGLWLVDSHLCAVLSELSLAASLMGARTLLSGMKPDIALTLETMGVELKGVRTTLNLEDALSTLGVRAPADDADFAAPDSKQVDEWSSIELTGRAGQSGTTNPFPGGGRNAR